jgi:hypothetical protein
MKIESVVLASLMLSGACAHAADPVEEPKGEDEKMAEVAVTGVKGAELKPYRVMSAGLDAFDEYHRLAPAATLKFRLSKRSDPHEFGGNWDSFSMRLVGNDISIPVPIAADGSFVLPRNQQAYDDEADLILNQKKSLFRFSPEVRTPGVPANARRLGDLRLECQVTLGIGKKELNFAQRMAINTIMLGGNWCGKGLGKFWFSLPDRALGAAVVNAGTRKTIPTSAYQIVAPIQDKSLPDDALIEFEFWSAASTERKLQFFAQWPIKLKTSADKWNVGAVLRPKDNTHYSTDITLKPGKWEFHLDSPGAEISLGGGPADTPLQAGVDHAAHWHWKNLTMNVEQAGTYEVALNVQDPDHPVVNVRRLDSSGAAP